MSSTRNDDPHRAWGIIYSQNNSFPKFYLTDKTSEAWLVWDMDAEEVKVEGSFDQSGNMLTSLIKRPKPPPGALVLISKKDIDDETFLIKVKPFLKKEIEANGRLIQRKKLVKDKCVIEIRSLHIRVIIEAFCDESVCEGLSELSRNYRVMSLLGSGGFGSVYRTLFIPEERFRAVKAEEMGKNLRHEYRILSQIDHECIVRIYELMDDHFGSGYVYLSIELCEGGSLRHRIASAPDTLDEPVAKHIFRQMLQGVAYLHEHDICHRDIKLANTMLTSDDRFCGVKLIDFGLSCSASDDERMIRTVGTVRFMAPEMLINHKAKPKKRYTELVDVWGIGMCLFVTLVKRHPFPYNKDAIAYREEVFKYNIDVENANYQKISSSSKLIIRNMLTLNPLKRPSCSELLQMEWFNHPKLPPIDSFRSST